MGVGQCEALCNHGLACASRNSLCSDAHMRHEQHSASSAAWAASHEIARVAGVALWHEHLWHACAPHVTDTPAHDGSRAAAA